MFNIYGIIHVPNANVSRTTSAPNSALRYCLDTARYFGLEFSSYPLLIPNYKTETPNHLILNSLIIKTIDILDLDYM